MSTTILKRRNGCYTIEATRYSGPNRELRGQITVSDGSNWTTIDLSKAELIDLAVKIIYSMNTLDLVR